MKALKINYLLLVMIGFVISSCEKEKPAPTFSLSTTVSPVEGGNITISPATGPYNQGQNVTITAQPNTNWVFKEWDGDSSGSSNPLSLVLNSDKSVTAVFEKVDDAAKFYLAENGITCKCENANSGDKGIIEGATYEAVDNSLLRQRKNQNADMTKLCTSLVTDMYQLFFEKSTFDQPIGHWDVSNVTNMAWMFSGYYLNATQFNQPIGDWDVSKVTDMNSMFASNSKFNQPVGSWDVSNVIDMSGMFGYYIDNQGSPFNQPLGDWDVSNVTTMSGMFFNSSFNQPIGNWDVSNVTNMESVFGNSQFDQPIGNWDVSKVTTMFGMFAESQFNQPIGNWDVSSVTEMSAMFAQSKFNQPIGDWDVSNVKEMWNMFLSWEDHPKTMFNQPIGNWDVSNVTDMRWMFNHNIKFNQDLSKWCVNKFSTKPEEFSKGATAWVLPKPVWGTCPD